MRSTGIDRRTLLRTAGSFGLGLATAGCGERPRAGTPCFVAARQEAEGRHTAAVFDLDAGDRTVVTLPGRGHDVAVSPHPGSFVVFARRPGRFAVAVGSGNSVVFTPPDDRHFYGHGCFSPSGNLLYATENDFRRQRGVIGIYSSHDWRRLGEFESFGVGPHDLMLLPDGRTLAVANGGIATDPTVADGRSPVGLSTRSDLALVDRRSGELRGQWRLPASLADLSIRHLTLDRTGAVWFGAQWEGRPDAAPPLLGRLSVRKGLQVVETRGITGNLANYVGSVAVDRSGTLVAASSPREGTVAVFDAVTARLIAVTSLPDGCGLAAASAERRFVATSGGGMVHALDPDAGRAADEPVRSGSARWDNHLRTIAFS